MRYYLDTNIIIYSINGKFSKIKEHFLKIPSESIAVPSVVLAEIEYGARKSRDYQKTINLYRQFIKPFQIVPFIDKMAVQYGIIRSELEKEGNLIGPNDLEIASIALTDNAVLVTHNLKEFTRVKGLLLEDWTE